MKRYALLSFLLIFIVHAFAQKINWIKGINTTDLYIGTLVTDDSDNVYMIGMFDSIIDVDPGPAVYPLTSKGSRDAFVVKLDPSGNLIWGKSIGGIGQETFSSIKVDREGSVFLIGVFGSTVDFDPDSGIYNMVPAPGGQTFLLKLNSNGHFTWVKGFTYQASSGNLEFGQGGDLYFYGTFYQDADFDPDAGTCYLATKGYRDVFILKLDSLGHLIWGKSVGGPKEEYLNGVLPDQAGNIFITGSFRDSVDFDPGPGLHRIKSAGEYDIFMLKLDTAGDLLWVKTISGPQYDLVNNTAMDTAGNIYVYAWVTGEVDINPDTGIFYFPAISTIGVYFIEKLTSDGNFVWAIQNNSAGLNLAISPQGSIFMSGNFSSTIDADPGPGEDILMAISKDHLDLFVQKFDSTGSFLWAKGIGSDGYMSAYSSLSTGKWDQVYMTGNFSGTLHYNPIEGDSITSKGENNTFILRIDPCNLKVMNQPQDQLVHAGENAKFTVTSSSSTVAYQWQKFTSTGYISLTDSGHYSGTTHDSLIIDTVMFSEDHSFYRCVISDGSCSDTSDAAGLLVDCVLSVTDQPSSQSVHVQDTAYFSVTSSLPGTYFQWQKYTGMGYENLIDSGVYAGVNTGTMQINEARLSENHSSYRCIIFNFGCSDTSHMATLLVDCELQVSVQPVNQAVYVNDDVQFTTDASQPGSHYQWQKYAGTDYVNLTDSGMYTGVTTSVLHVTQVMSSENNSSYRCIITNGGCADTSQSALLFVSCALHITSQPLSQSVEAGENVIMAISASSPTVSFQWQADTGTGFWNLTDNSYYSGTFTDTLTVIHASSSQDNTHFRCIIVEYGCADTSHSATVTVTPSTGIQEWIDKTEYRLYPNPVKDHLAIERLSGESIPYMITTVQGVLVLSGNIDDKKTCINLNSLQPGFYFIYLDKNIPMKIWKNE